MTSNNSTVVYSNDRSGMSGVGNYVVQSVTINGKQQTLPTMCPMMHWQILRSGENLHDIQVIRAEWNVKVKNYEEKGYNEKKARAEEQKLCDIEFLKKQNPPGPFTRSNEVSNYLSSYINDAVKNKRLYIEIRLAKRTCLSLKPSFSIFRLKRAGRNLLSDEYGQNLISYLDNSHSQTTITISDLKKVLTALNKDQLSK